MIAAPLAVSVTQLTVAIGGKRLLDGGLKGVFERKPKRQPSHCLPPAGSAELRWR
jgi:hypothetical protein